MIRSSLLLLGMLLVGCDGGEDTDVPTYGLIEGPELLHEQLEGELIGG